MSDTHTPLPHTPRPRPCPECRGAIGSRTGACGTCNRFSQAVLRRVRARLKDKYPEEYAAVRQAVIDDLYTALTAPEGEDR